MPPPGEGVPRSAAPAGGDGEAHGGLPPEPGAGWPPRRHGSGPRRPEPEQTGLAGKPGPITAACQGTRRAWCATRFQLSNNVQLI